MVIARWARLVARPAIVLVTLLGACSASAAAPGPLAAPEAAAPEAAEAPPVAEAPQVVPAAPVPGPSASPSAQPAMPRVHHAAPASAPPHVAFAVHVLVESPHLVQRTILVYRVAPSPVEPSQVTWKEADFMRSTGGAYEVTVPKEDVRPPGFDYAIELVLLDGTRQPAFASRLVPQHVGVYDEPMDVRERILLERLGGRRSLVKASFDYVRFSTAGGSLADWYYRAEGAYTYRVLRTIDEFSIHVGAVRGRAPGNDGLVGLNYAAAALKFRLADVFRLEAELLTSVTEVGFAGGGGGAIDIGDPLGAKLVLGFEAVQKFGARWYSKVDVPVVRGLRLSPIVEATSMPHADRYGVRLLGEVAYDFGNGFAVAVQGGYQARVSTDGSPGAGAQLMYAF